MYSMQENKELLGIEFIEFQGKPTLIDVGIRAKGGWAAAKAALQVFLGGRSIVEFGKLELGSTNWVTVDLYWDDLPASWQEKELAGGSRIYYVKQEGKKCGAFLSVGCAPDGQDWWAELASLKEIADLPWVIVAAGGSLVDNIFKAAFYLTNNVTLLVERGMLSHNFLWGWGSCPLASFKDQVETLARCGAVSSFWVKGTDESLAALVEGWNGYGEIRLHGFWSGRTFVRGKVNYSELAHFLNNLSEHSWWDKP
ncbi:methenyltetrahydromethanopterin cyclohydrolase [Moorellaceae bacterium AZ2]